MRIRLCLLLMAALPSFFSANARAELPPRYDFIFIPELDFPFDPFSGADQMLNNAGQIVAGGSFWQNGSITALGGSATSINNAGQIAGSIDGHAVVWNGGVPSPLQSLSPGGQSHAVGINDSGQAIGWSDSPSGREQVIWNGVTPTPLTPAIGDVVAINNKGQIVGQASHGTESEPALHAVLWEGGTVTDLGTLGGRPIGVPQSINDSGQVVGFAFGYDYGNHGAFLWQDGEMTQLPGSGDYVHAFDINDKGQIVGEDGVPSGPIFGPGAVFGMTVKFII